MLKIISETLHKYYSVPSSTMGTFGPVDKLAKSHFSFSLVNCLLIISNIKYTCFVKYFFFHISR